MMSDSWMLKLLWHCSEGESTTHANVYETLCGIHPLIEGH